MATSPNVLVIMSDQHNRHVMGCSGDSVARTPNLDRLAAEGVRFGNAYCPAPLCVPCRMSFLTSRLPSRIRVWDNSHMLSPSIPTWLGQAGQGGHETTLIGRMHLMWPHHSFGFSRCEIGDFQSFAYFQPHVPFLRPEPSGLRSIGLIGQRLGDVTSAGRGSTYFQWQDRMIAEAACRYLREKAAAPEKPFVAAVGFFLPHCAYVAPRELFDYYYERVTVPEIEPTLPPTIARFRQHRGLDTLTDHQVRVARAAYYGLCELVDAEVGRVVDTLRETGLIDSTLVIYCSDHGDAAGEHGCWWKSNYYEGSAGVPLIMRFPNDGARGRSNAQVANLMDLGPTVLDFLSLPPLEGADGRSLLPGLQGEADGSDQTVTFSELCETKYTEKDRYIGRVHHPSRMIRRGEWKLWYSADPAGLPPALFNLRDDPGETRDLGSDARYTGVREELLGLLLKDWDPLDIRRISEGASVDAKQVRSWFFTVLAPELRDSVRWVRNDPQLEDDLELL